MSIRKDRHPNFIPVQEIGTVSRALVPAYLAGIKNTSITARYFPPDSPHNPKPLHHTISVNDHQMTIDSLVNTVDQKAEQTRQLLNNRYLSIAVRKYLLLLQELKDQIDDGWVKKMESTVVLHEENHALQFIRFPSLYRIIQQANDIPSIWSDPEKQRISEAIKSIELVVQLLKEVQAFVLQHISVQNPNSVQRQSLWISGYRVLKFLNNPKDSFRRYVDNTDLGEYDDEKYTLAQVILFSQSFEILDFLLGNEMNLDDFCDYLYERFLFLCDHPDELSMAVCTAQFVLQVDQELSQALTALRNHLNSLYLHHKRLDN